MCDAACSSGNIVTGLRDSVPAGNDVGFTDSVGNTYGLCFETAADDPTGAVSLEIHEISTTCAAGDLALQMTCLLTGTRIATPDGLTCIEDLAIGDHVMITDGSAQPIRWIGRRTLTGHGRRDKTGNPLLDFSRMLPIRIMAGALGEALPLRDLLVSPCHAVLLGRVLVQAGALVNGGSIRREARPPETFTYYHLELAHHALVLAEGVATETFVDHAHRLGFDNGADYAALYPDAAPIIEMDLPRVHSHRQLPMALRARLERCAALAVRRSA